jgi:hypothetical protein
MNESQEQIILTALTHVDWVEHQSELTPAAPNGKSSIVLAAIILAAEVRRLQKIEAMAEKMMDNCGLGCGEYLLLDSDYFALQELLK